MDLPLCSGCRERDALIASLQARVAQLEAAAARQQQTMQRLQATVDRLTQRLAQYEPEVEHEARPGSGSAETPSPSYSLDAEEKRRRRKRRRKKSPGRHATELKFAEAERVEDIYPEDVPRSDCHLARERAVWRLENGRAVRVGYRVFRGPDGAEPRIPGVTLRCEYGIEILVVLAFLVYVIGISLDKACAVLTFFCQLPLAKSQADALLRQLARHWQGEFEILCDLIARAAVVYMDETGWKIGSQGCALWTFASELHRVFLFGCHKDAATLDAMLPPDVFDGIGVSDDAAVYQHRFARAQKCWAHLLRKAIKLALLYPRKRSYQRFLDRLLKLYHDAKRAAADQRLGEHGRKQRVAELEDRLCKLCQPYWHDTTPNLKPHERDFANLVNELVERALDEELFTFVLEPAVEPTNNRTERLQRSPALDRKAGRTSKTATGAERRTIIASVLESLRANLEQFTLSSVLEEVQRWMHEGISLFAKQWQALIGTKPTPAVDTG
jgi:transposase